MKVLAINQDAANASVAHFAEGDFLGAGEGGHAAIKAQAGSAGKSSIGWAWSASEPLPLSGVDKCKWRRDLRLTENPGVF